MAAKITASMTDFAEIIRTRRRMMKLSQAELARRAGVHRTTIIRAEQNPETISLGIMLMILHELGMNFILAREANA